MIVQLQEVCVMARNSNTQNKQLGSEYSPKTEVDTQDLEVIKVLRYNATVLKWAVPLALTLLLAMLTGLGWLAKTALMGEIRAVIRPIEQRLDRIEVKQENTIKRLDKLEEKR